VLQSARAGFAVQIGEVQRQLVDDLRLARQDQRREAFTYVAAEIHGR
jgi:hypothetical protein